MGSCADPFPPVGVSAGSASPNTAGCCMALALWDPLGQMQLNAVKGPCDGSRRFSAGEPPPDFSDVMPLCMLTTSLGLSTRGVICLWIQAHQLKPSGVLLDIVIFLLNGGMRHCETTYWKGTVHSPSPSSGQPPVHSQSSLNLAC